MAIDETNRIQRAIKDTVARVGNRLLRPVPGVRKKGREFRDHDRVRWMLD